MSDVAGHSRRSKTADDRDSVTTGTSCRNRHDFGSTPTSDLNRRARQARAHRYLGQRRLSVDKRETQVGRLDEAASDQASNSSLMKRGNLEPVLASA